ncbi:MAG: Phage major capsid protein [Acidimicrobiaceae bacterium]|nr:Phage major capsid protein [Acidimicrobiaceae bacterium]
MKKKLTDEQREALRSKFAAMPPEEFRTAHTALRDEITTLGDKETLSVDEEARFDPALEEFEIVGEIARDRVERARKLEGVRASVTETAPGIDDFQAGRKVDPFAGDIRSATPSQLRDRALKVLETEGKSLAPFQQDHLDKLLRTRNENTDGAAIARRILTTENEHYRSAFVKGVTQDKPAFSPEEARAIEEFRAANEGTGSAGGFGIPVLIDPTIILTSGAVDAPILQISRTVTITTDAWKGVSSAGVQWSYDAEASAVSDDTPTLVQPNIPVYAARGFIPYSIEVGQDYPGFADEMAMLLNQGFIDLVASQTMTGSGSASPTGIFTRMASTTTNPAHITVTTLGVLGAVDVRKAWGALPERFRPRATWVMAPTVEAQVRAFGNGLALSDFTVNLLADGTSVLTGKPVVVSDYAPAFTGVTTAASYTVVGDFSNFLIVQRAGMTVELVNHLFDTSTGRPTGQRGWFAYARHGFDAVNPRAFVLVSNT